LIDRKLLRKLDWSLLLIVALLTIFGLVIVYAATQSGINYNPDDPLALAKRQGLSALLGWLVMMVVIGLDYRILAKYARVIYTLNLLSLGFVLFLGRVAGGSQRWFRMGFVTFQPSELAKIALIITLARYLSEKEEAWDSPRALLGPFLHVSLPMILVLAQPDLGTALIFIGILFGMLFIAGVPGKHLAGIVALGGLAVGVLLLLASQGYYPLLKEYQIRRLVAFVNPYADRMGSGWNVIQSMIAIGSGGLLGKGLLAGSQVQLNFLPAHHTDFIFSVVGEELGFVGATALLGLFFLLLMRGMKVIHRAKDDFGRLVAAGILSMFFFHIAINVAMTIGLAPVTGIPLPFISYGGSSLLTNMMGIGLLLNIHMRRQKILF
jgi:rod shape determining protein RodA